MEDKIQHSKPVPPFVRFCAANIPMVFDDSLSYYECLCALWKWLQTDVIDVINNNATVTQKWREELTEFEGNVTDEIEEFESDMRSDFSNLNDAFDTLKTWVETYFDNLDVQQEINNKLDDMAEQGVLADIISQYLNSIAIFGFDTVASMKTSENLVAGSYARTMGYYSVNDGGGALYKIREITNDDVIDESFIIEMDDPENNLIAEYIKSGDIYVEQLGVLGLADSTSKLQSLIDYAITNDLLLKFGNNVYNITSLQFKTAKLKFDNTTFNVLPSDEDVAIKIASPYKGCTYSDFTIHGIQKTGIRLTSMKNITLRRIRVEECKVGVDVVSGYELSLLNSLLVNTSDIVDSIGIQMNTSDCVFEDIVIQGYRTGVKTLDNCIGVYWNKLHIWSTIADTVLNSIGFDLHGSGDLQDCTLDTCLIGVKVRSREKVVMTNCRYYWNSTWFNDTVLDGATPYLIYFDDKHYTNWFEMYNCYGYKPSVVTTLNFSNITQADWEGLCNIQAHNRNLMYGSFTSDIPVGQVTSMTTHASFTDAENRVMYNNDSFSLDYVGQIAADASTGQVTIGNINTAVARPLPYDGICTYGNQWDANAEGLAYLYINNTTGAVITKITEDMKGKYIKIHLSYSK